MFSIHNIYSPTTRTFNDLVRHGTVAQIQDYLSRHPHYVNHLDDISGEGPLYVAVKFAIDVNQELGMQKIDALMQEGANPHLVNRDRKTPLSLAVDEKDSSVFYFIIGHRNMMSDININVAIISAINTEQYEIFLSLLRHKYYRHEYESLLETDHYLGGSLHAAVRKSDPRYTEGFLSRDDFNPYLKDTRGNNALDACVQASQFNNLCQIINVRNFDMLPGFDREIFLKVFFNVVKLQSVNQGKDSYNAALHSLIDWAQRTAMHLGQASNAYARYGANKSVLRIACELDRNLFARQLVAQGANPFLADADGRSPLSRAFEEQDVGDVRLLTAMHLALSLQQIFINILQQLDRYSFDDVNNLIVQLAPETLAMCLDSNEGYDYLVRLFSNQLGCMRPLSEENKNKLYQVAVAQLKVEGIVAAIVRVRNQLLETQRSGEYAVSEQLLAEIRETDPHLRSRLAQFFANPRVLARLSQDNSSRAIDYMAQRLWQTTERHPLEISIEDMLSALYKEIWQGKFKGYDLSEKSCINLFYRALAFLPLGASYVVSTFVLITKFAEDSNIEVVQLLNEKNYRYAPLIFTAYQQGCGNSMLNYLRSMGLSAIACNPEGKCALSSALSKKDRGAVAILMKLDPTADLQTAFAKLIEDHNYAMADVNRILLQMPTSVLSTYLDSNSGYDFIVALFSNSLGGCQRAVNDAAKAHLYKAVEMMDLHKLIAAIYRVTARRAEAANISLDKANKIMAEEVFEQAPERQSLLTKLLNISRLWKGRVLDRDELQPLRNTMISYKTEGPILSIRAKQFAAQQATASSTFDIPARVGEQSVESYHPL